MRRYLGTTLAVLAGLLAAGPAWAAESNMVSAPEGGTWLAVLIASVLGAGVLAASMIPSRRS